MPYLIKTDPFDANPGQRRDISEPYRYGGQNIRAGDETFVWFDQNKGGPGLIWRGVAEHIETADRMLKVSVVLRDHVLRPFRNDELEELKGARKNSPEFGVYRKLRLYAHDAIRYLTEDEARIMRSSFSPIDSRETNSYFAKIQSDLADARKDKVDSRIGRLINDDLSKTAMEGCSTEQRIQIRQRAAWLATQFVKRRAENNNLQCDDCLFDPHHKTKGTKINPRSLLDVHHKNPLEEGIRVTTVDDFALLCPTCHRFIHASLRVARRSE
jgi:hypothetical protein